MYGVPFPDVGTISNERSWYLGQCRSHWRPHTEIYIFYLAWAQSSRCPWSWWMNLLFMISTNQPIITVVRQRFSQDCLRLVRNWRTLIETSKTCIGHRLPSCLPIPQCPRVLRFKVYRNVWYKSFRNTENVFYAGPVRLYLGTPLSSFYYTTLHRKKNDKFQWSIYHNRSIDLGQICIVSFCRIAKHLLIFRVLFHSSRWQRFDIHTLCTTFLLSTF